MPFVNRAKELAEIVLTSTSWNKLLVSLVKNHKKIQGYIFMSLFFYDF